MNPELLISVCNRREGQLQRVFLAGRWILLWAFLAGSVVATTRGATEPPSKPVRVRSFKVEKHSVTEWGECHGFVRSRNSVDVLALVTGRVKSVHVKSGQRVHKEDLLVELETEELQARLDSALAGLASAVANQAEARRQFDRIQGLSEQKSATPQQLDEATARWKSAEAAVASATAQVEASRTSLHYATLRSPMDGIIVDKRVNPGDLATVGVPTGRSLMTVYDPDRLWFEANIPERFAGQVTIGAKARIVITPANVTLESKFVEVLPEVDEASRTFLARVDLPSLSALKLGMLGRAGFVTGHREVVEIPGSALVERGQLDTVFVFSEGKARLRLVRGGKRSAGNVEILSGLTWSESVILDPRENLRDGDPVEIAKP